MSSKKPVNAEERQRSLALAKVPIAELSLYVKEQREEVVRRATAGDKEALPILWQMVNEIHKEGVPPENQLAVWTEDTHLEIGL